MLLLVGYVGEPMGYFCCVLPLVEPCLFSDFGVNKYKYKEIYGGGWARKKENLHFYIGN